VTGTASTSGTLTDTATVFGSNGVDVLDSDQLDLPISATGCAPVSEPPPAPPGQQGVAGADIPVNPQQTVLGDTVPIDPGNAHLAGKTGCVRGKFAVSVRGKHINKVVFSIDGKRRASVSKPDAKGRYKIVVDPRKYRPGSHVVTAKTTFEVTSATRPKTMKLRFSRCVRAAAPAFTG
jgi:hypothetical protein